MGRVQREVEQAGSLVVEAHNVNGAAVKEAEALLAQARTLQAAITSSFWDRSGLGLTRVVGAPCASFAAGWAGDESAASAAWRAGADGAGASGAMRIAPCQASGGGGAGLGAESNIASTVRSDTMAALWRAGRGASTWGASRGDRWRAARRRGACGCRGGATLWGWRAGGGVR